MRRPSVRRLCFGAAIAAWSLPIGAGADADAVAIGVAPFELRAAPASDTPDGAPWLAHPPAGGAENRVDVPSDFGVDADGQPTAGLVPAAPAPEPGKNGDAFGFRFDGDRPVSIRSDELESSQLDGSRKLVFTQNVVVVQDEITIRSHRLEAYYPPQTDQPSRLVASGRVRMSNASKVARCDHATYERATDLLVCRGNADLRDDDDCVAGDWIEFNLLAETIKVGGGATVILGGENSGQESAGCQ